MTTPKKPQDHLPSKSDQLAAEAAPPPGADLLKPVTSLPSWDRLDLTALLTEAFENLGINLEDEDNTFEVTNDAKSLRALASMQRGLIPVAVNEEAYITFASGPNSVSEVTNLAMWYLAAMGESMGSAA
ncbi:hypothetical protein [Herbiconiux sp. UC225_62]|uniref:hypothetical protein n=1 Tax=Herbiconiux sp. UC225_62 TaxID=3350168 RepID=UPI0036D3ED23